MPYPDEKIELEEDDEYARVSTSITEGIQTVKASSDVESDDFEVYVSDSYPVSDQEIGWCAVIGVDGMKEDGVNVSSSISLSESASKKLVEELSEFWDWEGDGYSSSE